MILHFCKCDVDITLSKKLWTELFAKPAKKHDCTNVLLRQHEFPAEKRWSPSNVLRSQKRRTRDVIFFFVGVQPLAIKTCPFYEQQKACEVVKLLRTYNKHCRTNRFGELVFRNWRGVIAKENRIHDLTDSITDDRIDHPDRTLLLFCSKMSTCVLNESMGYLLEIKHESGTGIEYVYERIVSLGCLVTFIV